MKNILTATLILATFATTGFAKPEHHLVQTVSYDLDGVSFESAIVSADGADEKKPGILMVPNWMGPTAASLERAKQIAGDDYLVMMVDMYGTETRPANADEAAAAATFVRNDRDLMRARASKALEAFRSEGAKLGLDPDHIAAIGFCFGGGTVLELGRSGADVDVIASFHGDLISPTLEADAGNTKAKVLVLHGADDPYVPQSDVATFLAVMQNTSVDWQLVQYGGAVHSFTNPQAASDGARYHASSDKRSFEALDALLEETWGK